MPLKILRKNNERLVWWYSYWPKQGKDFSLKPFKFRVGDRIRVSSLKGIFDREYNFKWPDEIFIIKNRYRRDKINVYRLKDYMNEDIKGSFYEVELQKVKVDDENKLCKTERS